MYCDDVAISASGLSKCYQIYDTPRDRLKQFVLPAMSRITGKPPRQYFHEFWALRDISFEIRKGETVGIIGRNGSGKSTLLQIVCGTLTPTHGTVETTGRIAALLELGSGFNPDFTGRENVYMNAALLGLTPDEVDRRMDDILSFADIGQFIDQPVKTYSSGMSVRLAFAVQSQVEPDILVVDEALAVGDAKFQAKCFERLRQLKENGTSILLVTHSSEQIVSHCSHAILLNEGLQVVAGAPRHVVNRYLDLLFGKEPEDIQNDMSADDVPKIEKAFTSYQLSMTDDIFASRAGYNQHEYRWGDGSATVLDFLFMADDEPYPAIVAGGARLTLAITTRFNTDLLRPIVGITIKTKEGITVYGANSESLNFDGFKEQGKKGSIVQTKAEFACPLGTGDYFISIGIATKNGDEIIPHDRRYDAIHFQVRPDNSFFGLANLDLRLSLEPIAT